MVRTYKETSTRTAFEIAPSGGNRKGAEQVEFYIIHTVLSQVRWRDQIDNSI